MARGSEGSGEITAFQHLRGPYKTCSNRTRGRSFKIKEDRFRMDIENFFNLRVLRDLTMFPRQAVAAAFLEVFQARLSGALRNQV